MWIKVHILFLDAKIVLSVLSQCLWRLTNSICLAFSVSSTSHGEANLDTWSSQNHTSLGISSQWTPRISSLLSNFASQKTRKDHGRQVHNLAFWLPCFLSFCLDIKTIHPKRFLDLRAPQNLRFQEVLSSFGFLTRTSPFFGVQENHFSENFPVFFVVLERIHLFFPRWFWGNFGKKTHDLFALENLSCSEFWKLKRLSFTPEVYFNFLGIRIFLGPIRWRDGHRRASGCGKKSESFSSPRSVDKPSMIEGWMQEIHLGKKSHAKIPELSTEVVSTSWIRNKKSKLLVDLYLRFFPTSWF